MRYYNENPQVTLWKENNEKWKSLAKDYLEQAKCSNSLTREAYDLIKEANKQTKESLAIAKTWEIVSDLYLKKMRQFNSLPWYKKMFYKFKI